MGTTSIGISLVLANAGTVEVLAGTLSLGGAAYLQTTGGTVLDGGAPHSTFPLGILSGLLVGSRPIGADASSAGTVSPGFSPGALDVSGTYTQGAGGTLDIELAGPAPRASTTTASTSAAAQRSPAICVSRSSTATCRRWTTPSWS